MAQVSPIQISILEKLEQESGNKIKPGDLGVIMARAGVGKSTFMVRMGLEELKAGRGVAHFAMGQSLSDVQTRYKTMYGLLYGKAGLMSQLSSRFAVQAYSDRVLSEKRLQKAWDDFSKHLRAGLSLLLIDGLDWGDKSFDSGLIRAIKRIGKDAGASICMSVRTHRDESGAHPIGIPKPVLPYKDDLSWAVFLEPVEDRFSVRLLYAFGVEKANSAWFMEPHTPILPVEPKSFTLLSGGAAGAESFFGACAERHGLDEKNFTFEGRVAARQRGLVYLDAERLKQGDVSIAYVKKRMHRDFRDTDEFRKVLQTIWHQVSPAAEVFVVGTILTDATVKGGTGWAVELAKHLGKTLYIFDQEKLSWFTWSKGSWEPIDPPYIRNAWFAGTGTRALSAKGKQAISDLFERSFKSAAC